MPARFPRRRFVISLAQSGAAAAAGLGFARGTQAAQASESVAKSDRTICKRPCQFYKSLKWGMIQIDGTVQAKFEAVRDAGFDGVELDSPGGPAADEVRAAVAASGVQVDGTVDSTHWQVRLTDPDPKVRSQALADLRQALEDTARWGGHTVLLVPGHGRDGSVEETWQRSAEQICQAIPTAARLGVQILIENVWNQMFYEHEGADDQSAEALARYIDQFDSPWVGVQFDIGNHQKYGRPADWIRTLGRRIVKLDVKDWGPDVGFCKIGDGAVDWPAVREALQEIGFNGWAAAEVAGGGAERLTEIAQRMDSHLLRESSR